MFLAEVEAETRAVDVRWEKWPGSDSSKSVDSIGFEHKVRSERKRRDTMNNCNVFH